MTKNPSPEYAREVISDHIRGFGVFCCPLCKQGDWNIEKNHATYYVLAETGKAIGSEPTAPGILVFPLTCLVCFRVEFFMWAPIEEAYLKRQAELARANGDAAVAVVSQEKP